PVEERQRRDVRIVEPPALVEVRLDGVEHVLEQEAHVAHEVAADRIGAAIDRRQVLEQAAPRDPDRDLGTLVDHLAARRALLEHGVAILVALAVQRDDLREPGVLEQQLRLAERTPDDFGHSNDAAIEQLGRHVYLMSSRTFSATWT